MVIILSFFILIQILFFLFLGYLKIGEINNPITYFNIWWGLWFILSLQGIYGLYEPSLYTFFIIYFSMFMVSLGMLLVIRKSEKNRIYFKNKINFKFINTIQLLLSLVLVIFLFITLSTLLSTGISSGAYRELYIYGSQNIFGNHIIRFIFLNFLRPLLIVFFLISLSTYLLTHEKKSALILSGINIMFYSGVMMGRIEIFRIILFYLIGLLIIKVVNKEIYSRSLEYIKVKINKKYLIIGVMLMALATYFRDTNRGLFDVIDTAVTQFILYFTAPFIALDHFITNFNLSNFELGLGKGFMGGLEVISSFLKNLITQDDSGSYASYLLSYADERIIVGDGLSFNAFYTMIFRFYSDGMLFGTILFPLILGLGVGIVYNLYLKKINIYTLSLSIYVIHILIFGSITWPLGTLNGWMVIFIIGIFYFYYEKLSKGRYMR